MLHERNRWRAFWNTGGWWKAALLVVGYWLLYQLVGLATSTLFASAIDAKDPISTPASVMFGIAVPIAVMGALLLAFSGSLRWTRSLFKAHPVLHPRWLWAVIAIMILPVVLRVVATDWSRYSWLLVLSILLLGLCIGFAEELLTRGIAVRVLQNAGFGERTVLIVSATLFAVLHLGNVVSGQSVATVLVTAAYAFGFGGMMYLALISTGRLWWAIALHAITDPTTILATGGIDTHGSQGTGAEALLAAAAVFNVLYLLVTAVAIWRLGPRSSTH